MFDRNTEARVQKRYLQLLQKEFEELPLVLRVKIMNAIIKTDDVYYEYITPNDDFGVQAVKGVSMTIEPGKFVVVLGRNGSGKSTLARLLNGLLLPRKGTVIIDSMDTHNDELIWEVRKTLGLVLQNPDNQIVATTVEEDVAFGPENLGIPPAQIREKIDRSLRLVGMEAYGEHSPHMLSGGQKQRIAIAGILAMEPKCIVLDEATSMLDPHGRREVMDVLKKLNREKGITIVLITHHMEEAIEADQVMVMEDGRLILKGTPRQIFENVEEIRRAGLDVPQITALAYNLKKSGIKIDKLPLNLEEMAKTIKGLLGNKKGCKEHYSAWSNQEAKSPAKVGEPIIKVRDLSHIYMQGSSFEQKALTDINLTVNKGEILGIIGQTGSGKSTLVQHFNGILKPVSGTIEVDGLKVEGKQLKELRKKVGLIFQYPEHQLFEETVYKDIIFGLTRQGMTDDEIKKRVFHAIDILGISPDLLDKSPFELSGGQKRRVAIAGVLVMEPKVLVLDEPTAGLDPHGSSEVFKILSNLNKQDGTTIIIISHNMEEIAAFCDRVAVMHKGRLIYCDETAKVFSRYEELKSYGLDIPKITELFRVLYYADYGFPETVLTVDEAKNYITQIISTDGGGAEQ
ncbi:MAG: energy-coupling factor transporter ATPase [Acetivibrionales bacterium]|jgi:energy-coupling factor transporter ATPase